MRETSPKPFEAARPSAIPLPGRSLVAVSGPDATHFLHNLLTANIETIAPGAGRPAALLTPQGKIIADLLIFNASDDAPLYLIDIGRGFVDPFIDRLMLYRLRADVSIERIGEPVGVMVCLDCGPSQEALLHGEAFYTFADPRHPALGFRLYGPAEVLKPVLDTLGQAEAEHYHMRRVQLGIPEGGQDFLPSDRFPHDINLDQLGGVDFAKGCYIGQEVVSRMEHRGSARTRTMIMQTMNGFGVNDSAELRAGEKLIGMIGESARDQALALVRTDKLQDALANGESITAGGLAVTLTKPAYATF